MKPSYQAENLFRSTWWSHIGGHEHRWARALNSSQCFAINLFAPLVGTPAAIEFVRTMAPDLGVTQKDRLRVSFEQSPRGVAQRVGERRQPTQIDVFLEILREQKLLGVIGVEVKLSEREFGGCRGFLGRHDSRSPTNPDTSRCLDGRRVFEAPERECFMVESEGRLYWSEIKQADSSFDSARLASLECCPFRHGLYQMMRNRVTLDVLRSMAGAEWCEFVVCSHSSNQRARRLPEPVAGESDAIQAFRHLTGRRGVFDWDPARVVGVIESIGAAPEGWAEWIRSKYRLTSEESPFLAQPASTAAHLDQVRSGPSSTPSPSMKLQPEIQRRLAAFLAVANRAGIEKLGLKIERICIKGEPGTAAARNEIERQLRRWVETSPGGRYAGAIPAAEALYAILFDPAEREKFRP